MVFYYSATGNSYWVAKELAKKQGEQLISVADELKRSGSLRYEIREDETIGFVFPVHAWNPPDTMLYFIKKMQIEGYADQYVFSVATCGDSCGYTMRVLEKALSKKGLPLGGRWEMPMPNNYLPMQDTDSADVEREKLEKAAELIEQIAHGISGHSAEQQLIAESFKTFKTSFIGFFFRHFGKSTRPFYVTTSCTGCGLCEKICLRNAITIKNRQPCWTGKCDQCYACIHRCPQKAIQYGKKTETRGRYYHPLLRNKDT